MPKLSTAAQNHFYMLKQKRKSSQTSVGSALCRTAPKYPYKTSNWISSLTLHTTFWLPGNCTNYCKLEMKHQKTVQSHYTLQSTVSCRNFICMLLKILCRFNVQIWFISVLLTLLQPLALNVVSMFFQYCNNNQHYFNYISTLKVGHMPGGPNLTTYKK